MTSVSSDDVVSCSGPSSPVQSDNIVGFSVSAKFDSPGRGADEWSVEGFVREEKYC